MISIKECGLGEFSLKVLGTDGVLSVVMPAFRLEKSIADNVKKVFAALADCPAFEIVVVEDGSGDDSAEAIRSLVGELPPGVLVPVILEKNGGKGNALREGVKASRGSHILLLDGDLDLSPDVVPVFLRVMSETKADIVIGSKRHADSEIDYPWHRRLASAVYYSLVQLLTGLPVTDTQTGMKLFRREAIQCALDRMLVKSFAFDVELLSIAFENGYKVAEAPVRMEFGGKLGCLRPGNVYQVLKDTLAVFYRLRVLKYYRSVEPVQMPDVKPKVSVVIACPAWSTYLGECLHGLAQQTYSNFEVIVLPDAGFQVPVEFKGLALRILPTGKIRPAEKRNMGVAAATGSIIAFLDDDAWPIPEWLEFAVPYFSKPDIGALGGPGVTPPNDCWFAQMGGLVYANTLISGNYRYRYVSDRVRSSIDDYPSCNLFVRTEVFRAVGGFSTRYWPGEDTILCSDVVHKKGLRIVYDPRAVVFHHRRALFLPHLRQIGRYALHRGYFAKRFPKTSFRISYMIPSFFFLGVAGGPFVCMLLPVLWTWYAAALAFYGAVTLLFSFHCNVAAWAVVWLGVMVTHLIYGFRFLQGLMSWKMPCEVTKFDHPAEQNR